MRRHHIVFAVDREGFAIEEWLQHDDYFTPPRGSGLGEVGRGPHKILQNPYDPERHLWVVDDDQHMISTYTNDGELVKVEADGTLTRRALPGLNSAFENESNVFVKDDVGGRWVTIPDELAIHFVDIDDPANPAVPVTVSVPELDAFEFEAWHADPERHAILLAQDRELPDPEVIEQANLRRDHVAG